MKRGVSSRKLWLPFIAVIALGVILYAPARSRQLQKEAAGVDVRAAIVKLELASRLNPFDAGIINQLADRYLSERQYMEAVSALRRNPIGESGENIASIQLEVGETAAASRTISSLKNSSVAIKAKLLLEQGSASEAITTLETDPEANGELLILARALDGRRTIALSPSSAQTVSQPLRALEMAARDNLWLAQELYDRGLLSSSERTLARVSEQGAHRHLLAANIALRRVNDKERLNKAKKHLVEAVRADPGSMAARRGLSELLRALGDSTGAKLQSDLVKHLGDR